MKKGFVFAVILVLAFAGTAMAQTKLANTKHDLSSGSTAVIKATDTDQVCIFCHTPHRGSPATRRPLWNHEASATATLTWSPTKTTRGTDLPTDATAAAVAPSMACLSCHDGSIALGSVLVYYTGGSSGTKTFNVAGTNTTAGKLSGGSALINPAAMQSNHPIGIPAPAAKTGYTPFKASPTADAQGVDYDANGNVQCQSCHNPHLYSTIEAPFLRKITAASALCVTCHDL